MQAPPPVTDLMVQFESWYASSLGREVAAQELACLEEMLDGVFGHYLLEVEGGLACRQVAMASHLRHHILLPSSHQRAGLGLRIAASPERMPIANDSLDAVLLPHTLEFAADPHQVLREAERVLIPEGRLLILGFNALSPWALLRLFRGHRVPWCGDFLSRYRVNDWLSLLGFDVEQHRMLVFHPPWSCGGWCSPGLLAAAGRRFWPALGGVFAIRAVKRVSTLTPLRPSWKTRRKLIPGGAIEPTTRGSNRVRVATNTIPASFHEGARHPPEDERPGCGLD